MRCPQFNGVSSVSDSPLQAAFRHIDLEIPERLSRLALEAGVKHCSVLTSSGSNANSWFLYFRTKGEVCSTVVLNFVACR